MSQKASANDAKEIWEFQGTLLRGKESAQFIFSCSSFCVHAVSLFLI